MSAETLEAPAAAAPSGTPPHPLREFWTYFSANRGAVAGLVGQRSARVGVQGRIGKTLTQLCDTGFERVDPARQLIQFALVLVAQLALGHRNGRSAAHLCRRTARYCGRSAGRRRHAVGALT